MNGNLVIAFHQIQLGKYGSAMETGGKVLKVRKGIAIRSGGQIEAAIFTTGLPGTIRFGNKVEGRGPGAARTANNAGCFQLCFILT